VSGLGSWVSGLGFRGLGLVFRVSCFAFWFLVSGFGPAGEVFAEGSRFGLRVRISGPNFGFRALLFGFQVSSLGFQVLGFGFGFSGFRFGFSSFEFRFSGFGFRVSGFGQAGVVVAECPVIVFHRLPSQHRRCAARGFRVWVLGSLVSVIVFPQTVVFSARDNRVDKGFFKSHQSTVMSLYQRSFANKMVLQGQKGPSATKQHEKQSGLSACCEGARYRGMSNVVSLRGRARCR